MATLTNRLQVSLDDERLARLEREAARSAAPIAELVRRAIDRTYPPQDEDREEAWQRLLAAARRGRIRAETTALAIQEVLHQH